MSDFKHTTYVTPAGFVCTCGATGTSVAGGEARRHGQAHAEHNHAVMGYNLIDYRVRRLSDPT